MARGALTLWFAIATLLGPGVCCCTAAADSRTSSDANLRRPAKPIKSCCSREPHTVIKEMPGQPLPEKPGKCPCERGKAMVDSVPGSDSVLQQFDAPLRLANGLPVDLFAPYSLRDSSRSKRPSLRFAPSHRECLTAYCVMRC